MVSNPVSCYTQGINCLIRNGERDEYRDVSDTVWSAISAVTGNAPIPGGGQNPVSSENSPVYSRWNLTAFPCGAYSVFTYVDRTTRYDLWLEKIPWKPDQVRKRYTATGESAPTRDGLGTLELSVQGALGGENKSSWTNDNNRAVVLTLRKMIPNPVFDGGPYWDAPGHTGMANDSNFVTAENCKQGDKYTVVLEPGETIAFFGAGATERDGASSYWAINFCDVTELTIPATRIHTRLIDGTVCECIHEQEVLVNEDTCETKRVPVIWRTKGLAGAYLDVDGKTRFRGEYIFLDPFVPHDIYHPIPGMSPVNATGALDQDTGKIFRGEGGIALGETHVIAHSPQKWRTEITGALQPPDPEVGATQTENKSFELELGTVENVYRYKRLTAGQLRRIYMTQDQKYATYYDSTGQIQTDVTKLVDGSSPLTYEMAWAENAYGESPALEIEGFTAEFESGVAEQMVERFCKDFTQEGDITLGTMPLIWFKKIHDEKTATVVFKGMEKVAQFPFACAGVSQFGSNLALMCLEHVHNNDAMMTEHAHLQVFVLEPRSETWGFEHNGFAYGGGAGLNGVYGTSKQHNHFSTSNHHYTHATLSPYLPNIFGSPEVGSPPLRNQSGVAGNTVLMAGINSGGTYLTTGSAHVPSGASDDALADDKAIGLDTSQEMIKPDTKKRNEIGRYITAKPSYALILLSGAKGKENRDEDVMPSERPRSTQSESSIIWRVGNMESPVAYDHAGHWRETWADVGVQSGVPLTGGIFPWNGLPAGYNAFGGQGGSHPWTMEARRMEDALKHSQFDFVPSKPLIAESGVGVVGSNGMLVCFNKAGEVTKYNIEHFALEETDQAIVPNGNSATK